MPDEDFNPRGDCRMVLPAIRGFMRLILEAVQDGNAQTIEDLCSVLAQILNLSSDHQAEVPTGGGLAVFRKRVEFAKSALQTAGLIECSVQGTLVITEAGKQILEENHESEELQRVFKANNRNYMVQKPWSDQEAALLLRALIDVLQNKTNRKTAISVVSKTLRQLAVRKGMVIDEKFRNENGIALMMYKLEYVFTEGRSGLFVQNGWFFKIVDIYKNNPEQFENLCKEVTDTCSNILKDYYSQDLSNLGILSDDAEGNSEKPKCRILENSGDTTLRIPWSDKEAALLLRALIDVLQNKIDRKTKISEVSLTLRQMAVQNGIIIDEKFRNENGVGFKMGELEFVFTGGKSGIPAHSGWCFKIVEIYQNHPEQFEKLCEEVEDEISHKLPGEQEDVLKNPKEDALTRMDLSPYREILTEKFQKGFRIDTGLHMNRFRLYWKNKYGTELSKDDEAVRTYLTHITVRFGDFVYLPEMMVSEETRQRLFNYISECFKLGKKAVYFDALYKMFQHEFAGKCLTNQDMLKSYLTYANDGSFFIHRKCLTAEKNIEINPADEIRDYMFSIGRPVTVDELKEALSHIDSNKIDRTILGRSGDAFVINRKGEYFHGDIVNFTQQEINNIEDLIQQAIDDKKYMGDRELTDAIENKLPSILERYDFLTQLGLRDVIAYKLKGKFSFKRKIISAYGQDLSLSDVFEHYGMTHDRFTMEQLKSLQKDLNSTIYFDSVYKNSLRISENEFVSKSKNKDLFDVDATDDAVNRFCNGDYIAIKEISFFGSFPNVGFQWNSFLLEQYVAYFSGMFRLMHVAFRAGTPAGAIVKKVASFESYNNLLGVELANSSIPLDRDSALRYLVDKGFLATRSYGDIDSVLATARSHRTGK